MANTNCTPQNDFASQKGLDEALAKMAKSVQSRNEKLIAAVPPGTPKPVPVAKFPPWPDAVRAVPNGILRSALFGAVAKGRRRYINGEDLAAVDGVTIRYKGERLDQGDLDVWESVLHAVRLQELGSVLRPAEAHGQDRHRQEPDDATQPHRAACSQRRDGQAGALHLHRRPDSLRGQGRGNAGVGHRAGREAAPAVRRRPVHADRMGGAPRAGR